MKLVITTEIDNDLAESGELVGKKFIVEAVKVDWLWLGGKWPRKVVITLVEEEEKEC